MPIIFNWRKTIYKVDTVSFILANLPYPFVYCKSLSIDNTAALSKLPRLAHGLDEGSLGTFWLFAVPLDISRVLYKYQPMKPDMIIT